MAKFEKGLNFASTLCVYLATFHVDGFFYLHKKSSR